MNNVETVDTEQRIIAMATQVFIEKGYEEANMSYIAERVGINRPTLHYYFRTKDKRYEAVYTMIFNGFIPAIQDTLQKDIPVEECIADIVGIYFNILEHNPSMPLFVFREIQRDAPRFLQAVRSTPIQQYVMGLKTFLEEKMGKGQIRHKPLQHIFYTFNRLLITPILLSPLTGLIFNNDESQKSAAMTQWKDNVVSIMQNYLCA